MTPQPNGSPAFASSKPATKPSSNVLGAEISATNGGNVNSTKWLARRDGTGAGRFGRRLCV